MTSKYRNKKCYFAGRKFDSKKEMNRYIELLELEKQCAIRDLTCQPMWILCGSVKFSNEKRAKPAMKYIADFSYIKGGELIVEDVKSEQTKKLPAYRIKRHLMLAVHGIEVVEV